MFKGDNVKTIGLQTLLRIRRFWFHVSSGRKEDLQGPLLGERVEKIEDG